MRTGVVFLNAVLANITSVDLNECKISHKGTEFLGEISTTDTGLPCENWDRGTREDSRLIRDELFPEGSKALAKNYCRNPDSNPKGPWCYTSYNKLTFSTCAIPLCKSSDCRVSGPGLEYAGLIEKSASGKKCAKWKDAPGMETVIQGRFFPEGSVEEAGRKCRNPDGDVFGPWCFVEKDDDGASLAKELCDIPFCDDIGNFMYSEGSDIGEYSFFSTINNSESLNISFRLWNPESWRQGQIFLYLSTYDTALSRKDIKRWKSGIEMKFTHLGSGILYEILSAATWTDLEISWCNHANQSMLVNISQKSDMGFTVSEKIVTSNTLLELETFRYISLGGSPAFWNMPSSDEDCPVHTVTQMKSTRFWIIKKTTLGKDIRLFIRANKDVDIILRRVPMSDAKQVKIAFRDNGLIKIVTSNNGNHTQQIAEASWSNVLDLWKWEHFKIKLLKEKLQVFWEREAAYDLLVEVSHENVRSVMWVSFRSPRVSYWTIYCDPRGISDPPRAEPPECVSQEGEAFNGTLSITWEGRQCIPWMDIHSLPEKYQDDKLFKPYGGRAACQNFCRNLDSDPKGAYCVVRYPKTDVGFVLDHCHPRSCILTECKLAGTGSDYTGQLNITRSKRKCKVWTEVKDSVVDVINFPDPTLQDASNFCRNPSKSAAGTWCFTTDARVPRDVCYIKDCDKPLECTILTRGYVEGSFIYILPPWRKNGLQFALKAWNPDIYGGLIISFFSLDRSRQYCLRIGDEGNEKLKLFYKDDYTENLLVHKTLPHLIPAGKWKGYWLRSGYGKIELGYQGVPTSFFEWSTSYAEFAFKPMLINYGTMEDNWMGINFQCSECLTMETSRQDGYKIYPINLWQGDTSSSKLRLNLRGNGSAFVTLLWTQEFEKVLALEIVLYTASVYIVKFSEDQNEILGSFPGSCTVPANEWSEYIISFSETSLTVHKDAVQLLEWTSPFPLLIYWFTVTADRGVVTWTANCPVSDIDRPLRDGGWGRWGSWSCSVTCGKGKGRIERKCDDPLPNVFGEECKGSPVYEGPCNDFPCGKISPDTNNRIRRYLSTQHKSLQVDASERVVLSCNPQARSLISGEVPEMNITWTHNGFPYSRTRFHMDENYSLVISRAQEKHCGIYLCMLYQEPESIPSKIVLEVISLVVIRQKPTKRIRKGRSLTLKCNGLALSYVYADLSQRWELNGVLWKDYGLGTLQTFTVDKLENVSDSHEGVWTCVIIQEDFKFKWTTNWLYIKVKSAPSFWSYLMEDVTTAPLFGKLGNERNAKILFFVLIGAGVAIIILIIIMLVRWIKK